nr:cytochrome c biogenesis heme-transporting ATPase CcmA [Pseudomonas sp. RIT-PI-S]
MQGLALACERDWRLLFEGLDVSVRAGEMLKVSGPNGSGKTSLLRLLCGLLPPSAGEVRFNGQPLPGAARALAANLLWLGHAPALQLSLTPRENLAWLCALGKAVALPAIDEALRLMGLRGHEDQPCQGLSAGQLRRVALARLYLDPPPLWLLDEPFTALDAPSVARLEARLVEHCEAGGLVVLTSHHVLAQRPAGYRELHLGETA